MGTNLFCGKVYNIKRQLLFSQGKGEWLLQLSSESHRVENCKDTRTPVESWFSASVSGPKWWNPLSTRHLYLCKVYDEGWHTAVDAKEYSQMTDFKEEYQIDRCLLVVAATAVCRDWIMEGSIYPLGFISLCHVCVCVFGARPLSDSVKPNRESKIIFQTHPGDTKMSHVFVRASVQWGLF